MDDNFIPLDAESRDDLRIRIRGRHLLAFYSWFDSGKSRETSPWREFYEELVSPGVLPRATFPYVYHDYVRREIRPIRYSQRAQSLELLIADIFELLPNEEQRNAFMDLKSRSHPLIMWTNEERIRRLGAIPGDTLAENIGEQTIWTL